MNGKVLEVEWISLITWYPQTKDGKSFEEVKIRLRYAHSATTRLAVLLKNETISFHTKIKLHKSLVLLILLYECENWTLTADVESGIQAFENNGYRSMINLSHKEHRTNEYVRQEVNILAGSQEL